LAWQTAPAIDFEAIGDILKDKIDDQSIPLKTF
jgi:hypothetical protein